MREPEPIAGADGADGVELEVVHEPRYRYTRPVEFVFASPMVPLDRRLRAWAEPSFPDGRPLDEAAIDLMHRLHADFLYAPDSTHVATPLIEAFELRRGVCQDFAHILIGALRSL